ncbi:MAG: DUF3429 domain-containing protein [Halieaceae bacterium]|jgi:hypothetical protein|nr:DUF3429 domain-containing protein [Halieaceae bacterium]
MPARTLMRLLGYAGLTPFIAAVYGTFFLDDYPGALARQGFLIYSLAILCFLAGTLWGSAMHYPERAKFLRLLISNGIVIFAVLGILTAQPVLAACLLMLGYMAMLWYERNSSGTRGWYPALRARLTWVAVGLHLLFISGLVVRNGG